VSAPVFMFCAPELFFDGIEGVVSRFQVLRARTLFRRYRGRRLPLSYFALPDTFSAVPKGPVFIICAPRLIFGGTEGVRSCFHVLHSRTLFRRYRGRRVSFFCFTLPNSFSVVSGCRLPFSCLARLDSLSAVPRASTPIFMFCTPELVFDGTDGVGSCFHVLRSRTHFLRYRRVSFSCFALPDSFSRYPGVVYRFHVLCTRTRFPTTEGIGSHFNVFLSRTIFRRYRGRRVQF
jgi:hypothetical protein